MDFPAFLAWLTGADQGAFVLVTAFAAVVLEDFGFWHALRPRVKALAIAGLTAILGISAVALAAHPETVAAIGPFWGPFSYFLVAWLASQGVHTAGQFVARLGRD